jgi:hypothetical protein
VPAAYHPYSAAAGGVPDGPQPTPAYNTAAYQPYPAGVFPTPRPPSPLITPRPRRAPALSPTHHPPSPPTRTPPSKSAPLTGARTSRAKCAA